MLEFTHQTDPEELQLLARAVRRFGEDHLLQQVSDLPSCRARFDKLAELGLAGLPLPESSGGSHLPPLFGACVMFELSRFDLAPAICLSVHHMVSRLVSNFATESLRARYLSELASGKALGAFGLTEAHAGSDASSLRMKAVKKGKQYVLNGEKIYISSAGIADLYVVFAKLSADTGEAISAFLVPTDTPGVSIGNPEKKMGCAGSPIANVTLSDCILDDQFLLGKEGDGYRIALSGLNGGRVNIAACACGLSSRAIELAGRHLLQREQFQRPLAEFQGLQFMLSDMYIEFAASKLLTRTAAEALQTNPSQNAPASAAKCYATDAAMRITTDAVQCFGGAGYLEEYVVERLMREAKMLQIVEGTNQIQRSIIAKCVFDSLRSAA